MPDIKRPPPDRQGQGYRAVQGRKRQPQQVRGRLRHKPIFRLGSLPVAFDGIAPLPKLLNALVNANRCHAGMPDKRITIDRICSRSQATEQPAKLAIGLWSINAANSLFPIPVCKDIGKEPPCVGFTFGCHPG